MSKKVAILQSNYIPWKGYFDLIQMVDEFILYDAVQYTKNDWRNRNLIKTSQGIQWLTIPVHGGMNKLIQNVEVANNYWAIKHWKTLELNYSKTKYFKKYHPIFSDLYTKCHTLDKLSQINYLFIKTICQILNIRTKLTWSIDYDNNLHPINDKTARLIALCQFAQADCYYSGPSARSYINEELFAQTGIKLHYVDYGGYPHYKQMYGEFAHTVSIVDLIFNEGPNAMNYMKSLL